MKKENRYKIAWISHEFLEDLFTIGNKINQKVLRGMPKTATIETIYYDTPRACFGVIVYDKSFRRVKEGEVFPQLDIKLKLLVNK